MLRSFATAAVTLLLVAGAAFAQSGIFPAEEAREIAGRALELTGDRFATSPVKVMPSVDRAAGVRGQNGATLFFIGDERLTADHFGAPGVEPTPVGYLFWTNMKLFRDGQAVDSDRFHRFDHEGMTIYGAVAALRQGDVGPVVDLLGEDGKPALILRARSETASGKDVAVRSAESDPETMRGVVTFTVANTWVIRLDVAAP